MVYLKNGEYSLRGTMSSVWNVLSLFPEVSFIVGVIVFNRVFYKQLVKMKFNTAAICLSNTSSFCRFSLGPREGNKQQKGKFEDRTINFKGIEEKFTYRHLNNM